MPSLIRPIALTALALTALAGCHSSGSEQFDPSVWSWKGELKSGTVHVRNLNGSIDVKPATDGNVSVVAAARWQRGNPKLDLKYQAIANGNDITICAVWGKGTCSSEGSYTTGPGFVSKLFSRGTDAEISFTVLVPTGVRVDLVTLNGSINVASTAPVKARNVNGSIKVATAVGPVDAETVNGSVDARMTTVGFDGPVRALTVNGTASLYVPRDIDGEVSMETMNGSSASDFALPSAEGKGTRHLVGTLGKGGRRIELRSMNGRSVLRILNPDGTVAIPAPKP